MVSKQMNDMRRKSPREFWKIFKQKSTNPTNDNIPINDFFTHFKNVASNENIRANKECFEFVNNFCSNTQREGTFLELDQTITISEIIIACARLGNTKSYSLDTILYKYFKESIHITAHSLELLFNHILNTQTFPQSWSTCVIIPLFKNGDSSEVNNYRDITLISCFAKLFTTIVNERLKTWAEKNDIIMDAQFGFKANYSTVDAIFILQSLIEKQFQSKNKLFCCS